MTSELELQEQIELLNTNLEMAKADLKLQSDKNGELSKVVEKLKADPGMNAEELTENKAKLEAGEKAQADLSIYVQKEIVATLSIEYPTIKNFEAVNGSTLEEKRTTLKSMGLEPAAKKQESTPEAEAKAKAEAEKKATEEKAKAEGEKPINSWDNVTTIPAPSTEELKKQASDKQAAEIKEAQEKGDAKGVLSLCLAGQPGAVAQLMKGGGIK